MIQSVMCFSLTDGQKEANGKTNEEDLVPPIGAEELGGTNGTPEDSGGEERVGCVRSVENN